ncbi:unnamed protein product [Camellia sinensis]
MRFRDSDRSQRFNLRAISILKFPLSISRLHRDHHLRRHHHLHQLGHLPNIFISLGRLLLESFVKKFILELKSCGADIGAENTSDFIYNYAISMPNLAGFWRGNVPTLLMVMPYTAIQFTVLHKLKTFAAGSSKTEDYIHLSPYLSYISGALAGCAATVGSYPFDLLRTSLASQT